MFEKVTQEDRKTRNKNIFLCYDRENVCMCVYVCVSAECVKERDLSAPFSAVFCALLNCDWLRNA
jgi:hypothetical protein